MSRGTRALLAAVAALACTARPAPRGAPPVCPDLCSDGSEYAPVARLFTSMQHRGDTITVVVDSGAVGAPTLRRASAAGPLLMARLSFRPFVAASRIPGPDVQSSGNVPARRVVIPPWHALAWGAAQPLAAAVRYGEVHPIAPARFDIVLPTGTRLGSSWLGFEVAGDAVDPRAPTVARGTTTGGVRVYVCDPRTLAGTVDSSRAQRLREAYTAAC